MAYADGNIIIGTTVDVGGIDTGLHKIQKSFKKLGFIAGSAGVIGLGTKAFYKLGKAAIDAASDLQEVQNVVDVAFKDMSYKIEEFSKICINYFGMSEFAAKQTAGSFMSMATSIGIAKETASDMAVELTGLTGDFASFYNISQQYAKVALAAVFTGETETMKRYGIILTEANLQEYALSIGIEKKVKKMSAAEKTLLRYNYVMEATRHLQTDFQRTSDNWANSVRVLKEQWYALMIAMGTVFMQKVQPIIGVLNTIIAKLIAIFKYLQELLGITSEIGEATFSDEMEDMADAVDDVGNAIKHQLAPFDKLNNLTSKASTGVDDDLSDLEKLYEKAKLSGYVIDAMKDFEIQVTELSDTVKLKLADIVNLFRRAKYKVETLWGNIKLNHWFSAGMNFGDMISSLEKFISDSISGVNWQKKGEEIGDFFKGIIWSDALGGFVDVLISALNGVIRMAVAALDKITLADIFRLARNYSKAATKLLRWLTMVFKKIDWNALGKKIGKFVADIDWVMVFEAAVDLMFAAISAAVEAWNGLWDGLPLVGKIILGLIAAIKVANWFGVTDQFGASLGKSIADWKKTPQATKALQGAIGVITILTSVAIMIDTINDIMVGDMELGSAENLFSNMITSLGTALGALTIGSAFGVSLGPAGFLITAGVTFLVNTIIDAIVAPTSEEKLEKLKEQLSEEVSHIDWVSEVEQSVEVLVNLQVQYQTRIQNIEGDLAYYRDMAEEWREMSEHYDELTSSEQRLVQLYGEELGTKFTEMKGYINEVTGAYEGTADSIQLVIDKTQDLMMLEAIQESQKDTMKALVDAKAAKVQAEQELKEFQAEVEQNLDTLVQKIYNETAGAQIEAMSWAIGDSAAIQIVEGNLKSTYGSIEKYKEYIKEALLSGKDEFQGYYDLTLKFSEIEWPWSDDENMNNMFDYVNAAEQIEQKISTLSSTIESTESGLSTYTDLMKETMSSITNKETLLALDNVQSTFENMFKGTDNLWKKNVISAFNIIKKKIQSGSDDVEYEMAVLYNTINQGLGDLPNGDLPKDTTKALETINNRLQSVDTIKKSAKTLGDTIVAGMSEGIGNEKKGTGVFGIVDNAKNSFIDKLGRADSKLKKSANDFVHNMWDWEKEPGKAEGQEIQDNLVDGLVTITPANRKKIEQSGKFTLDTWVESGEKTAKINSPSKVMRDEVGHNLIAGLILGINDGVRSLIASASDVMDALVSTFDVCELTPTMTIVPDVDMANAHIPDIVNGMVIPAQVSGQTSINNTVSGMTKSEFSEVLLNALSNLALGVSLETDSLGIFKEVQNQARIYTNRTHEPAFGG